MPQAVGIDAQGHDLAVVDIRVVGQVFHRAVVPILVMEAMGREKIEELND